MQSIGRVTDATLDVLEVLFGPDGDLYGLSIAELANRKTGVVYPILSRLELAGWVDSSWEADERTDRGPRRRFYRLTPTGLESARTLLLERRGAIRQRSAVTQHGRSTPRPTPTLRALREGPL